MQRLGGEFFFVECSFVSVQLNYSARWMSDERHANYRIIRREARFVDEETSKVKVGLRLRLGASDELLLDRDDSSFFAGCFLAVFSDLSTVIGRLSIFFCAIDMIVGAIFSLPRVSSSTALSDLGVTTCTICAWVGLSVLGFDCCCVGVAGTST